MDPSTPLKVLRDRKTMPVLSVFLSVSSQERAHVMQLKRGVKSFWEAVDTIAPFRDKCALFHSSDRNRKWPRSAPKFISSRANLEVAAKEAELADVALGS